MTASKPPLWTIVLGFPLAVLLAVIGWALARQVETALGMVGAAFFFIIAVVLLVADTSLLMTPPTGGEVRTTEYDGEPARYFARATTPRDRAGLVVSFLLGAWLVALGIVGTVTHVWLWIVALAPAALMLGAPLLALLGRYGAGGVWLTRTRVIDEYRGVRTQLARDEVRTAFDVLGDVEVQPEDPAAIRHELLVPRPWARKPATDALRIEATSIAGGAARLAEEIRSVR